MHRFKKNLIFFRITSESPSLSEELPPSGASFLPKREANVRFKEGDGGAGRPDLARCDFIGIRALRSVAAGKELYTDYGSSYNFLKLLCFIVSYDNTIVSWWLVTVSKKRPYLFETTL